MKPGWYQDPEDAQCVRWWDGTQWTADRLSQAVMLKQLVDGQEKTRRATSNLRWGLFGIAMLIIIWGWQIVDVLNRRL